MTYEESSKGPQEVAKTHQEDWAGLQKTGVWGLDGTGVQEMGAHCKQTLADVRGRRAGSECKEDTGWERGSLGTAGQSTWGVSKAGEVGGGRKQSPCSSWKRCPERVSLVRRSPPVSRAARQSKEKEAWEQVWM